LTIQAHSPKSILSYPPAGASCRIGRLPESAFLVVGAGAMRVACYIDGFNLYHAIRDLQKPHLKWLDLRALAQSLCRGGEDLVKVAYFSAYATWLPGPYSRHRQYVAALITYAPPPIS
jgi:hypothetical protein